MSSAAPPANVPPAGKARQAPKFGFATMIPLVIIHALSFIAFVIYLAGVAATEHQFRASNQSATTREDNLAFPWFLLVAYVVAMGLHAVVMVVPHLHFLKLFVAILLGITISWFGKTLDDTFVLTRQVNDLDHSAPHVTDSLSAVRCLDAGAVLCVLAMLAALVLITVNYSSTSSSSAAAHAPYAAPPAAIAGGEVPPPGMRQAVCPKCGGTTNYPPEYEAVCCASCQTVIQVGATAV